MSAPGSSTTAVDRQQDDNNKDAFQLKQVDSQDWWFCATAVPLIAATQGPLSNVLSIAALVNVWRVVLPNNGELPEGADNFGTPLRDPQWELTCNGVSLACGFLGNIFLLLHFIGRVRYIVALPLSILFWFLASGILIAITVSLSIYSPPVGPGEIYGQGYWHAILAAGLYMLGSLMLMANMAGYLLGHYPQDFDLNDDQRTLILQTTMYFVWLAGGAGIYERLEQWSNANALYFCHVSILTIGYGDVVPTTNAGRGFLFLYVPIGVIQLGLVISRIAKFAASISSDNIVKKHQDRRRAMTIDRSVTSEKELRERLGLRSIPRRPSTGSAISRSGSLSGLSRYGKFQQRGRTLTFSEHQPTLRRALTLGDHAGEPKGRLSRVPTLSDIAQGLKSGPRRRLLILKEDEDRFNAMRAIQKETRRFKSYTALILSIIVFAMLWLLGGVIFMHTEARLLELTYFESLYFCFVSLLTIGYGDISPKSNIGKPVFIVWSLIAVPSLTILIQAMSNTVVSYVDRKTNWLLPQKGFLKVVLDANPRLGERIARLIDRHNAQKRVEEGFQVQDPDEAPDVNNIEDGDEERGSETKDGTKMSEAQNKNRSPTSSAWDSNMGRPLASNRQHPGSEKTEVLGSNLEERRYVAITAHDFAPQLSAAIRHVARDVKMHPPKNYTFEEWLYFTRLIRYSSRESLKKATTIARNKLDEGALARNEEDELVALEVAKDGEIEDDKVVEDSGLIEWDWIGEDSPMLSGVSEAEWVLDRLCESLTRYARWQSRRHERAHGHNQKAIAYFTEPVGLDEKTGRNRSTNNEKQATDRRQN
ncbi:uncharacterized protein B0I36DRAFT_382151 [Microdochium trichocladiopsis]|uniref:Potassium channel domain-containing protein n=1 Tax=Microdochium trichocladiopsis TaxID=1682393 RepID=A0A9P9BWU6_9PEZI|nr:uncharacterized protein B0I36DRAFT_382151 [Microdochium trichocladiopsis]KAH7035446.1 hypothetical protein B0I36DRAFT_382151 [Microdochium trichocladiopsis]